MAKVLLVDDHEELYKNLKDWFIAQGHALEATYTGEDALQILSSFKFDVILLDWMLPGISGLDVCKTFRKDGGTTPIIFLTGKTDITSKETALDLGGDDYIVKPFDVRELGARIRSVLRRPAELLPVELKLGEVALDVKSRTLKVGDASVHLMPKEANLLEYLLRHPNQAINASGLLSAVWPSESDGSPETVRTWMKNLRQKLASVGQGDLIKTVPGSGYLVEFK